MSELKAYGTERIYWAEEQVEREAGDIDNLHLDDNLFYLKSEADKVIAELKADYKEACDRLQTANLIKDEQLAATRHHKYKRCLAMAKMCEERSARYDVLQEKHDLDWSKEIEFYYRWYMRWLELAEKFKESK